MVKNLDSHYSLTNKMCKLDRDAEKDANEQTFKLNNEKEKEKDGDEHIDVGDETPSVHELSSLGERSRINCFTSGFIAGTISRTMTAPMDRLKVVMQAGKGDGKMTNSLLYLYREGGFKSFWRGNMVNCTKIGPESAVRFMLYTEFTNWLVDDDDDDDSKNNNHVHSNSNNKNDSVNGMKKPTSLEKFVAGAGAGLCAQLLVYPMEMLKTRLVLSTTGEFRSMGDVIRSITYTNGVMGMYRGLLPSLLGVIPYAGIELMIFNSLKENNIERQNRQMRNMRSNYSNTYNSGSDSGSSGTISGGGASMNLNKNLNNKPISLNWMTSLLYGAVSSTCGQIVAFPFQVLRTKLQADKATPPQFTGMIDCLNKTLANDGILGLYRGLFPNFLKSLPAIAISYAVYESSATALQPHI